MQYKEMKTLSNKVGNVKVYWSSTEFRRYAVRITDRLGEYKFMYMNNKPTLKELKEYGGRYGS